MRVIYYYSACEVGVYNWMCYVVLHYIAFYLY